MKPTLLIITGPQGSGNHLFSKIFSYHKDVFGWNALYKNKWVGHDKEVFQPYWLQPKKLKDFDWTQSKYFVTSISCPFILIKDFWDFSIPLRVYINYGWPLLVKYQI